MKTVFIIYFLFQFRFNIRSLIWNTGTQDPVAMRLFGLSDLSPASLSALGSPPLHPFQQCEYKRVYPYSRS